MDEKPPPRRWTILFLRFLALAAFAFGVSLSALAMMPWQLFRGRIESRISARLGVPVEIGSVTRQQWFSLHPVVVLHRLRIAQPGWAGSGDLLQARVLAVRFAALPILLGRLRVEDVTLDQANVRLVRDAGGRWNIDGKNQPGSSENMPGLAGLVVRNSRLVVIEAKRRMTLSANWSANDNGVSVIGTGTHRGHPMRLSLRGAPVAAGRPWEFRFTLISPLITLSGHGQTERPLSLDRMTATVDGRATDAHYLDDVIQAGLPGTQAITIHAHVRHDKPDWHLTDISASVGRSPLAGTLDVLKRGGRTVLDGRLRFAALDFDDLASDTGQAKAAAERRAIGPRVIPDTEIHFEKLSRTDGRLAIQISRLIAGGPTLFRDVNTVMTMDHRRLTLDPLRIGLTHGALNGRVAVDHRSGDPQLSIDLAISNARVEDLIGSDRLTSPVNGHIRLTGSGRTIRTAIAAGSGRIALVGRDGSMDRRLAVAVSGDVFKMIGQAIGGDNDKRTAVSCVAAQFDAMPGRIITQKLVIDTAISRADGQGAILLPLETIDLAFTGRAKHPGAIEFTAPIRLVGSLSDPRVEVIPKSLHDKGLIAKVGAIVKGLSTGRERPVAPSTDCLEPGS